MKANGYSALQFALTGLALAGFGFLAVVLIALGFVEGVRPDGSPANALPLLLLGAALGVSGLLLLPSVFFSLLRLTGRPGSETGTAPAFLRVLPLLLLPIVLLFGFFASRNINIAWLALPPLHILAIGLPVLWFLLLGLRGLPVGSQQRAWGIFASGLVLGPAIILVLELVALAGFVILAAIWVSSQPALVNELTSLMSQFQYAEIDPEQMIDLLAPYLAHPAVLAGALGFTALLVPLIEELIKPIGVWLLLGRSLTPASGFTAGLISGAGYALFESLALTSTGEDWLLIVVARMGTAVIHILTTGLTGWAIAVAYRERRPRIFFAAYMASVSIHALWNGMTIMGSFSLLLETIEEASMPAVSRLGAISPIALGLLTLGTFLVLLQSNRFLRKREAAALSPSHPDAVL